MRVEDFLDSDVDNRFGNHGNIRILIDTKVSFWVVHGWRVVEEFPTGKKEE